MSVTLTYFPAKGKTELTRYILVLGGQEFKDERVKGPEWPSVKPTTPFGAMPVLTLENGDKYSQSVAIARYFASKFNLTGKTDEEKLQADMIVDLFRTDMWKMGANYHFEKDEGKKKTMKEESVEKIWAWLGKLEQNWVKGEGSFLPSGLSWADVCLFNFVSDLLPIFEKTLDVSEMPKLSKIVEKVGAEPKIVEWIARRPEYVM